MKKLKEPLTSPKKQILCVQRLKQYLVTESSFFFSSWMLISFFNCFLATPPQANKILQSGYLTKEGGSITTWKRRYFELTPTELRYYLGQKIFLLFLNLILMFNFTKKMQNRNLLRRELFL